MKNISAVISQKEQDIARLRKEIAALMLVVPLLEDGKPSWGEIESQLPAAEAQTDSTPDEINDLERYYPFVKGLQKSR